MQTTTEPTKTKPRRVSTRYHYAIRIRFSRHAEWRFYASRGYETALRRAENLDGALEILEMREITREQYETALVNIGRGMNVRN
jgi:hypothetical protein